MQEPLLLDVTHFSYAIIWSDHIKLPVQTLYVFVKYHVALELVRKLKNQPLPNQQALKARRT